MSKPWHIRTGRYGRAFARPVGFMQRINFLWRGWRPFSNCLTDGNGWWSKPSKNQALLEKFNVTMYD